MTPEKNVKRCTLQDCLKDVSEISQSNHKTTIQILIFKKYLQQLDTFMLVAKKGKLNDGKNANAKYFFWGPDDKIWVTKEIFC